MPAVTTSRPSFIMARREILNMKGPPHAKSIDLFGMLWYALPGLGIPDVRLTTIHFEDMETQLIQLVLWHGHDQVVQAAHAVARQRFASRECDASPTAAVAAVHIIEDRKSVV